MVTGACGTVGRELVKQLLNDYDVEMLIGIDNNESELFFLEQEFSDYANAQFILADIRDYDKISREMKGVQTIFHAAAYKHVLLCERVPFEAVQTNIIGVKNVINAASSNNVEMVIFTSTDKAVNPTNVMGTSKLMGERLMTAANSNLRKGRTIFISTRFGNVLGSRGSVIPIFRKQIRKGVPVTLTDKKMTRFIMSIREAVKLVINSTMIGCGGEVLITKMPAIKIKDLAEVMINELAPIYGHDSKHIKIEVIGNKPGEKMYEELMSFEETRRAIELENYFSVLPAFRSVYRNITYSYKNIITESVKNPYNSSKEKPMTQKELLNFLKKNDLLSDELGQIKKTD